MKSLMKIGAKKKAIVAARRSLVAILETGAPEGALIAACNAFYKVTRVQNINFSGCHFAQKLPQADDKK
jgi:hypothetical protein